MSDLITERAPVCMCGHAMHLHRRSSTGECRAIYTHKPQAEMFLYGDVKGRSAVCECESFELAPL